MKAKLITTNQQDIKLKTGGMFYIVTNLYTKTGWIFQRSDELIRIMDLDTGENLFMGTGNFSDDQIIETIKGGLNNDGAICTHQLYYIDPENVEITFKNPVML